MKLVPIGSISRLHGYKGAVVAFTTTGKDSALGALSQVWIGSSPEEATPYLVISKAWMPKGWKLELSEVNSESVARPLIGKDIYAKREDLPELSLQEFYISDLVGLEAFEIETKKPIGTFRELQESALNSDQIKASWWVFQTPLGQLTVPAVSHFIQKVDLEEKKIWLRNLKEIP